MLRTQFRIAFSIWKKLYYKQKRGGEASNYFHDNYDPNEDEIDGFRDSARRVG